MGKLHLSNRNVGPPGSFRYHIKELGPIAPLIAWVGPFHAFSDLRNEVAKRCQSNGIPIPSDADIEDQMCQSLPPGHCRTEDNLPVVAPGGLAVMAAAFSQGTRTLFDWWRNGMQRVSTDEVVRRSYICNECPENKPIDGCRSCAMNGVHALVNQIVANQTLPSDGMLQACAVCQCSLKAKVRLPTETVLKFMPKSQQERLWSKCWLRGQTEPTNPVLQ